MISLAAAAAIVYSQFTGKMSDDPEVLRLVGSWIAKHTVVYGNVGWGDTLVAIDEAVLRDGEFEDGAELIRFSNVTYSSLCIRSSGLARLIEKLPEHYLL